MDFGGPLPDVVYRCFEWEACEIEALDGTSLSPLVQGPWVTLFLLLLTSESLKAMVLGSFAIHGPLMCSKEILMTMTMTMMDGG